MKKVGLFFSIAFMVTNLYSQCDTLVLDYTKVINNFYARKYSYTNAECPVTIVAEFLKIDLPENVRILNKKPTFWPGFKFKDAIYFQCVNSGSKGKAMPKTGEIAGDFFMTSKQCADVGIIDSLKQGDKILIMGYTYVHSPQELSHKYSRKYRPYPFKNDYEKYNNEEIARLKERAKTFFIATTIRKIEE
jgi:hypothetical protein